MAKCDSHQLSTPIVLELNVKESIYREITLTGKYDATSVGHKCKTKEPLFVLAFCIHEAFTCEKKVCAQKHKHRKSKED